MVASGAVLATAISALASATGAAPTVPEAPVRDGTDSVADLAQPHVLEGDVADIIVRVRGSSLCSGTPINGARLVITAAHCVLDGAGDVTTVTVERDEVEYVPRTILVSPRHYDPPRPHEDAAVLVMGRALPGPTATLGDVLPTQGHVTLAGLQPIDRDGALLRGTSYNDRPEPSGAKGAAIVVIESRPAGCLDHATSIDVAAGQLEVRCGLVRGASGGGLFSERDGRLALHGVISTVDFDLSFNGLAPLSAVQDLLEQPSKYMHTLPEQHTLAAQPPTRRW